MSQEKKDYESMTSEEMWKELCELWPELPKTVQEIVLETISLFYRRCWNGG